MLSRTYKQTAFSPIVRFTTRHVLHVDDSPHNIAMGVAIGLFVGWTPVIGLHTLMVLPLAFGVRANKLAALACVWVTNIFTAAPIYYLNYLIGWTFLSPFRKEEVLARAKLAALFKEFSSLSNVAACFYSGDFWRKLWTLFVNIGPELWLGSLVAGTAVSVTAYFAFYQLIKWSRKAHTPVVLSNASRK